MKPELRDGEGGGGRICPLPKATGRGAPRDRVSPRGAQADG